MERFSPLARALIRQGLAPQSRWPFAGYPAELQAAVNAYDEARRTAFGRLHEPPMSDANKASIAPMIMAAIDAYEAHASLRPPVAAPAFWRRLFLDVAAALVLWGCVWAISPWVLQ